MRARIAAALAVIVAAGPAAGLQHLSSSALPPSEIPRFCADTLRDRENGACLPASSVPSLGALYPLSNDFYVDPLTGGVGLGTTSPLGRLHVAGDALVDGDLRFSGVADGIGFSSFNPAFETSAPMLTMFNSGISNPDRMVLGHSPSFPNYGLAYRDSIDAFAFQTSSNNPVLQIDLNGNNVNVFGALDVGVSAIGGAIHAVNDSVSPNSWAIFGFGHSGVVGQANASGFNGLFAFGNIGATGTKSFIQPHPSDPSKEICYVALEGNEAGTYFRGTSRLIGGRAVIAVPEDFRLVTEEVGLSVQVTPRADVRLWVEQCDLAQIVVRGHGDADFYYFVNGVRRGFADHEPIRENEAFVPRYLDTPFAVELPQAVRDILVESGVLRPDYTPDVQTAARLGWTLTEEPKLDAARHSGR